MPDTQKKQADFQQILLQLAYKRASENKDQVAFDLRGRAIYTLTLKKDDLLEIDKKLSKGSGPLNDEASVETLSQRIQDKIGFPISLTIRCHLDIAAKIDSNQLTSPYDITTIIPNSDEYMSVIPLYEELLSNIEHHHHAVRTQLLSEDIYKNGLPAELEKALDQALVEAKVKLSEQIKETYNTQIEKAPLTVKALNDNLDKARATIQNEVKTQWFEHFKTSLDEMPSLTDENKLLIFQSLSSKDFAKLYKNIPAHEHDILGVDCANKTVSYTTNSGQLTAHNKHEWHKQGAGASAFRFMIRNSFDDNLNVSSRPGGQLSAREPSVADVKSKASEDLPRIVDIFKKFHTDFDKASEHPGPIVYNLLTSINSGLENLFDSKNKQNESAERILKAAHLHNKNPKQAGGLVWVQNLAVNRHSDNLDKPFASALHQEVRLMADIAMLYTLQANLKTEALQASYTQVFEYYQAFLDKHDSPKNFYDSKEGREAAKLIRQCKQDISISNQAQESENIVDKANLALLKIYKHNFHYQEQYGSLVQALSVFVEKKSVVGCKSANERNEDVQKKVGALIAMEGNPQDRHQEMNQVLDAFVMDEHSEPESLRIALDKLVNKTRMYGDETSISHSDQAASSKLQTIPNEMALRGFSAGTKLVEGAAAMTAGLGAVMGAGLLLGLAFPPLGAAIAAVATIGLFAAAAVAAIGIITSGISALFKGYDTNKGCAAELENNVNKRASKTQSAHGADLVMNKCKEAAKALATTLKTFSLAEPVAVVAASSSYGLMTSNGLAPSAKSSGPDLATAPLLNSSNEEIKPPVARGYVTPATYHNDESDTSNNRSYTP